MRAAFLSLSLFAFLVLVLSVVSQSSGGSHESYMGSSRLLPKAVRSPDIGT